MEIGADVADAPAGAGAEERAGQIASTDSPAAAEAFAVADPYVRAGLVTRWRVREWTTVVGPDAEVALPPGL